MSVLEKQRPNDMGFDDRGRKEFAVDVPFVFEEKKADGKPTGTLELRGYASTWVKDRDEEWIDPAAFDKSLASYLRKNPIILWQHDMTMPIGTMKEAYIDEFGLRVVVEVLMPEENEPDWKWHAYHSIRKGIVKTFSIGGFFHRDFVMGREVIKEVELMETSVVSIPSNPESIFEAAVKALKTTSALSSQNRPRLHPGHIKQMKQLIGVDPISDPELVMMSAAEKVERYEMLAKTYLRSGVRPPAIDEWKKLEPRVHATKKSEDAGPEELAKTEMDLRNLTGEIVALTKKANGGMAVDVEGKRGRTVSQKNEQALRDAVGVLDSAEKNIDEWATQAKEIVANAKTQIDVVLKQVEGDEEEPVEETEETGTETDSAEPADDGIGDAVNRARGEE